MLQEKNGKSARFSSIFGIYQKAALVLLILLPGLEPNHVFAQIDLHAHLDLKPGVGPILRGHFFEAPKSQAWNSRLSTKASMTSLEQINVPSLIVVSFYSHPVLSFFSRTGEGDSALDHEYFHIKEFVESHATRFGIARNSEAARALLKQRKTALILSIEGSSGILETEADFRKWIDERGVAIVTPFHLTEDHFGGTALMKGFLGLANSPLDFLRSLWLTAGSCLKTYCKSTIGIKGDGRILIDRLFERKVWIDFAHANDMEAQDLLMDLEQRKLPLLVTHTQLRSHFRAERGLGEVETAYLKKRDGIIGLVPTDDMMSDLNQTGDDCHSGLEHFKKIVAEAAKDLGPEKVSLGSDANAPLNGLSPANNPHSNPTKGLEEGYFEYGQWAALTHYVAPSEGWVEQSREHFLTLWKKVRP